MNCNSPLAISIKAPHFVMAVIKQLERDYPDQLYHGGLDVAVRQLTA